MLRDPSPAVLAGQIVALGELQGARLEDLRTLLDERFAGQQTAMSAALAAAEKAVAAAMDAAEKAVAKAEVASEKRLDSVNEFRQQLADQTATFVTRNELVAMLDAIRAALARNTERIADLELRLTSRLDLSAGQTAGQAGAAAEQHTSVSQRLVAIGILLAVVTAVANVVVTLALGH